MPFAIPRLYAFIGGGIAVLLLGLVVMAHLNADAALRDKHKKLTDEAATVLIATRDASDNPDLKWEHTAGQIVAMGESRRLMLDSIETQNRRINEMAADAVRMRAEAAELRRIADQAQAQRKAALDRLSDMAATPGTREDCMTLLSEAEEALDLIREAGL